MSSKTLDVSSIPQLSQSLATLPYYEEGQVVTRPPSTSVVADYRCLYASYQLTIKNNTTTNCHLEIQLWSVKTDTAATPISFYNGSRGDFGGPALTEPMSRIADSPTVRKMWHLSRKSRYKMWPGREIRFVHRTPPFNFNPGVAADITNDTYSNKYKGGIFIFRAHGDTVHDDTTLGFVNHGPVRLDVIYKRTHKWQYDAGAALRNIRVVNDTDTIGVPLQVNKPVAELQTFTAVVPP